MTEINNNIDLKQQIQSWEINIEDIKKLFSKIPEKYLDDLSIDWDKDFDNEDIKKIISWDFDKTTILWKELTAKQNKISLIFLKEIIEKIDKRIKNREYQENNQSNIKEAYNSSLNNSRTNIEKIKNKKVNHKHFEFKIWKNWKWKEVIEKANFIETRIKNKNQKINQIIENIEKNKWLIDQINIEISIINSYLDFLIDNDVTKIDEEYKSLYDKLTQRINELIEKIKKLNREIKKANYEAEKIIYLEKEYLKLTEKFKKIINTENPQNNNNKTFFQFFIAETQKEVNNIKRSITNGVNSTKETFNRLKESIQIKKTIEKKASLLPNDKIVKNFLNQLNNIDKNKDLHYLNKLKILKAISKNLWEHIKTLLLNKTNVIYNKYNIYFSKDEWIDEFYKIIKKQANDIGTSYVELENFKELNSYFYKVLPIIEEIDKTFKWLTTLQKQKLIKESKYYLDEIINNFKNNNKIDFTDFKNFVKNKLNEIPILEKIMNKEANKMNAKEAKIALEYTNKNYKKLDERSIFSNSYTLNTIDDFEEIHNFQEKLIEIIIKWNWWEKKDWIWFDKQWNLWWFDKEKGNYLINIWDFITIIKENWIENVNSKTFASFLWYLDSIGSLTWPTLYEILWKKEFTKLQKLWKENNSSIARNLLKKVNLNDTIRMIKSFNIKEYNKRLDQLNTTNSQEDLENIIKDLNNKIVNASSEKEKNNIYTQLIWNVTEWLNLNIKKWENFDTINLSNIDNLEIDWKLKKIIKEKIENKIKEERRERIKKKINNLKRKVLEIFKKRFWNNPEFQKLENLISMDNIIDKNWQVIKSKVILIKTNIIKFIEDYNNKNPNKRFNIPYNIINNISIQLIDLTKLSINEQMWEINNKLSNILKKIENLQQWIKKLEKTLNEWEEKIKRIKKQIEKETRKNNFKTIEEFLKSSKWFEYAKKLKELVEEKKWILTWIKNLEELIQKEELSKKELSKKAIEAIKETGKLEIERRFTEEANNKWMTTSELKKDPEWKKILEQIGKKIEEETKKEINIYETIANWSIEEARKALEESKRKNEKRIKELEKTLFNNKENKQETSKIEKKNTNSTKKANIIQENYSFNSETWIISISENWKEEKIKLSSEEQKLIKTNPETLKNIINFYETLNKLWLKKLWSIKEQLFKSIENIIWIWFKIDWNYLNENEIKIFLNAILKSIWEKEIPPIFTLDSFLTQIEALNKTQLWGWEKIVNTYYWETYIENKFFEKFVWRNNTIIWFKQSEFENAIK